MPPGWSEGRSIRLDSHPVFVWKIIFHQLRDGLKRLLDDRQLLVGPASLQAEADYRLASNLLGRGSLRTDPISLKEIRDRIARLADANDRATIMSGGRPAVRLGDVRALVARLEEQDITALTSPWPGADRLEGTSWVPHAWSPEALRLRAERVATTALDCYRMTVDRWLPNFAAHLPVAAAWPVRILGYLDPGDPTKGMEGWPDFIWTFKSGAETTVAEFRLTDDARRAIEDTAKIAERTGLGEYSLGELPGIYGLTPAADLAAKLLWDDLKKWEWVSGILRTRG